MNRNTEKEKRLRIVEKILRRSGTSIEKLMRRLASKARLKTNDEAYAPRALLVTVFFHDGKLVFKTSYSYERCYDCTYEYTPEKFTFEFMTYLHKETTIKRLMDGEVGYFLSEYGRFLNTLYTWYTDYHEALKEE